MKQFKFVVSDSDGIHARPAGEFVKTAKQFESDVIIKKGEKEADAKKIFAVMGLAAKQGDEVTVAADGSDEDKAIEVLEEFMKKNL